MFDCSEEVLGYHNDEVTLPSLERKNMRERRDANRTRLKDGLRKQGKPQPIAFYPQGSYAMKTMVQDSENRYDIDDGVYFEATALTRPRGGEMTALEVKQMVRDALDDGSFKSPPEVLKNCVRIHYEAGYHVDLPVYRRVVRKNFLGNEEEVFELASTEWKRSDARLVTAWFEQEDAKQSPDPGDDSQLHRICRDTKKFAQSRDSWRDVIASGFMTTKLVTECYKPHATREDEALYNTMKAIRDRLQWNLEVQHPVTPNETITKGNDDPKARFLREKLSDAISWLEPVLRLDCDKKQACAAWDKVFNTTYFSDRLAKEKDREAASVLSSGLLKSQAAAVAAQYPVRKEGGGRYA